MVLSLIAWNSPVVGRGKAGWQLAPATTFTKQKLSFTTIDIKEAGFVFVWLGFGGKTYGGNYHITDGNVTSTATSVVVRLSNGAWAPIGTLEIHDFEAARTDGYYAEAGFEVTGGAQGTFIIVDGAVSLFPFVRGGQTGFYLNLVSWVLVSGKADSESRSARITHTYEDGIRKHGGGFAIQGNSIDFTITHGEKGFQHELNITTMGGLLGIDINFTTGEVFIGINANAQFSFIGGVQGYIKEGYKF